MSTASALPTTMAQKLGFRTEKIKYIFDGRLNSLKQFALLCLATDNYTYTFKETLHQPDAKEFFQATMQELDAHETRKHLSLMLRSDLPAGTNKILAIWSDNSLLSVLGRTGKTLYRSNQALVLYLVTSYVHKYYMTSYVGLGARGAYTYLQVTHYNPGNNIPPGVTDRHQYEDILTVAHNVIKNVL